MSGSGPSAIGKKKVSKGMASASSRPKVMLNEALFTDEAAAEQRRDFLSGLPFPHLMLRDVFEPEFLRSVRAQLLRADFNPRCNDLFDFHQTDDLKTAAEGPVAAFRELIYGTRFRSWMSSVTGIPLNDTIDISSAAYGEGSHLLCHDDDLSERRVAFIAYLIPEDWDATGEGSGSGSGSAASSSTASSSAAAGASGAKGGAGATASGSSAAAAAAGAAAPWSATAASTDGGSLDLFDCADSPAEAWGGDPDRLVYDDSDGSGAGEAAAHDSSSGGSADDDDDGGVAGRCILPRRVVTRLVPRFNSLAFFATSALSHHQVAEVLRAGSKLGGGPGSEPRLSISGWFHGPPVRRPPMPRMPRPAFALPLPAAGVDADADAAADGDAPDADVTSAPLAKRPRKDAGDGAAASGKAARAAALAPLALRVPSLLPAPVLAAWLTPMYLRPGVQRAARARFEDEASLNLTQLLADAPLKRVMRDLGRQAWRVAGPPNMRSYRVAAGASFPSAPVMAGSQALPCAAAGGRSIASASDVSGGGGAYGYLPDSLFHLVRALCSSEFAAFLSAVTGLRLLPASAAAASSSSSSSSSAAKPGVTCEVRCFGHGDYTLLYDPQHREEAKAAKRRSIAAAAAAAAEAAASAVGGKSSSGSAKAKASSAAASSDATGSSAAATPAGSASSTTSAAAFGGAGAASASPWPSWLAARCFDAPASASVLEATLCLTDPAHDDAWQDDETCGGFISYLTENEELLRVHPQANSLSLVLREGGPDGAPPPLMSFVKYVKAGAPGPRYDVSLQFIVLP